ncbi:BppU family phage baseplate upper protein [Staphylococcus epidermidis]|uniref:BppU family phage baseplate upper protein n=1 Tax=Staphylococcus epidermidis TaxID=1282 RepID=UPI0011AB732F|nr:BppU family phage baseplate upper protein [Staphylococcus epidermidis]MCG1917713.1 phage baseplate upper protein [Staphylococcus epidermidis]MDU3924820.1 BppU family phage baseplate upper protein [Staphylococcus aureus]MDU3977988.1 BppU family phage baseplate upper protein [Staphylococcus sp.]MDU4037948.1 BppU family phage baseplate upper protein [Lactococcus lactis]
MLQKLTDVDTNINVSTAENGFIGANFYTEDDGSAYIRITIRDNNEVLDFNKTDMTPRLDLFSSDGSIFTNEPLDILVPEGGVIQYKVSDNVIKHAGRMDAKLFLANSKDSVHVANFYFTITDSGMTGPIGKEIHVDSLQDLVRNVMKENAIGLLDDDFKDKLENDLKVYMEENADTFKLKAKGTDTGWQTLPLVNGITQAGTLNKPMYKLISINDTEMLFIKGAVSSINSKEMIFAKLPKNISDKVKDYKQYTKAGVNSSQLIIYNVTITQSGDLKITFDPKSEAMPYGAYYIEGIVVL